MYPLVTVKICKYFASLPWGVFTLFLCTKFSGGQDVCFVLDSHCGVHPTKCGILTDIWPFMNT